MEKTRRKTRFRHKELEGADVFTAQVQMLTSAKKKRKGEKNIFTGILRRYNNKRAVVNLRVHLCLKLDFPMFLPFLAPAPDTLTPPASKRPQLDRVLPVAMPTHRVTNSL